MEKFSVLISVYYRENPDYLQEALQSVFEQSLPPTEVVLVKDGPLTEYLEQVIADFSKQYDSLKVVSLPENVGLGMALNAGLKECSYELIARMDSDDICKQDRFEEQLKIFSQDLDMAVVGSWVNEFIDSTDNVVSQRKLPRGGTELLNYAKSRNPLNHPTVMFKRSVIEEVGGYQDFYLFEDYYLWVRVLNSGYPIYNIPKSLLYFRTNVNMIARRGGVKYGVSEVHFFRALHAMSFISTMSMMKNIVIRFPIRLLPNKIRNLVYSKILR